ncbi:dynein regulatory complex subunit 7 [Halictus rubicundus]|uniref:dynein regulatory complex subunit 7 n=1 Tax=Halictus rubicundus TaxID=77578 RepID=UPI0040358773
MSKNGDQGEFGSYESQTTLADTDVEQSSDKLVRSAVSLMKITPEIIKEAQQELGTIKLCWPELDLREDVYLKTLPCIYSTISDKEKVLAWYAENFRRQFHAKYPDRKPLLLVCENECDVQKFVSTTIRRSTLPYPELYTWQGCGKFVSDYINYVPLDKPLSIQIETRDRSPQFTGNRSTRRMTLKADKLGKIFSKTSAFWLYLIG